MSRDDLSFLDHLEQWLEAQVPPNLHELPLKMLETAERVTTEIFETLNIQGAPSISIPFPPFKDSSPPPPPPPPVSLPTSTLQHVSKFARAHPFIVVSGTALALTVGLRLGGAALGYNLPMPMRLKAACARKRAGHRGLVEDGMLKEAIVLLAPSPTPAILVPLTASLLKAGYVVLIAVPQVRDAEAIERRLSGLPERSALRVLIYDPEDQTTFPPFHRSLMATLTLRFPASSQPSGDPYNPQPEHVPHVHAFVSLYPLNPSPPLQPSALPALPTLLTPDATGRVPKLITLYPSTSVLATPDTFASQVLTANHQLLGRNLIASKSAVVISVYLGDINLPTLPAILSESTAPLSRREAARARLRDASIPARTKLSIIRDYIFGTVSSAFWTFAARVGLGSAARDYRIVERSFLRILKGYPFRTRYHVGGQSYLPLVLSRLPPPFLPRILAVLPTLPSPTGPHAPDTTKKLSGSSIHSGVGGTSSLGTIPTGPASTQSASASSSDHEGNEELVSSVHTGTSRSSAGSGWRAAPESEGSVSGASGNGLDGSWVGLESAN